MSTAEARTPVNEPIVRIIDLHKSFGLLEILKGVDLEVRRGQVVVVLGRSGSGKSTMLRCINHQEHPSAAPSSWTARSSARCSTP